MPQLRAQAANALTASRVALTVPFVTLTRRAVVGGDAATAAGLAAAAVFAAVALTDVYDGRVARRWAVASENGRVFDHVADIGFILAALCTYASAGVAPWWVPAAIAASFAIYVIDSWSRRDPGMAPTLIGSRIGHAAGVLNYVLIGVLAFNDGAGLHVLSDRELHAVFWLVPLYSGAAIAARFTDRRAVEPAVEVARPH